MAKRIPVEKHFKLKKIRKKLGVSNDYLAWASNFSLSKVDRHLRENRITGEDVDAYKKGLGL